VRIPPDLRSLAQSLGLNDWVFERRDFPLEAYCETVDDARAIVRRHQPEGENFEAAWEQIVPSVAQALDTEGGLADHALENDYDISDEGVWRKICCAGAWVVLARYAAAIEKGEWTPK
jgi:hypothetical protein